MKHEPLGINSPVPIVRAISETEQIVLACHNQLICTVVEEIVNQTFSQMRDLFPDWDKFREVTKVSVEERFVKNIAIYARSKSEIVACFKISFDWSSGEIKLDETALKFSADKAIYLQVEETVERLILCFQRLRLEFAFDRLDVRFHWIDATPEQQNSWSGRFILSGKFDSQEFAKQRKRFSENQYQMTETFPEPLSGVSVAVQITRELPDG